jgi:hypothetical protein
VNDTGEQEVRAREEENRVAFLAADLAALDRLWTEDFDRTRREIGGRTPDPRGTRAGREVESPGGGQKRTKADKSGRKADKGLSGSRVETPFPDKRTAYIGKNLSVRFVRDLKGSPYSRTGRVIRMSGGLVSAGGLGGLRSPHPPGLGSSTRTTRPSGRSPRGPGSRWLRRADPGSELGDREWPVRDGDTLGDARAGEEVGCLRGRRPRPFIAPPGAKRRRSANAGVGRRRSTSRDRRCGGARRPEPPHRAHEADHHLRMDHVAGFVGRHGDNVRRGQAAGLQPALDVGTNQGRLTVPGIGPGAERRLSRVLCSPRVDARVTFPVDSRPCRRVPP